MTNPLYSEFFQNYRILADFYKSIPAVPEKAPGFPRTVESAKELCVYGKKGSQSVSWPDTLAP